MTLSSQIYWTSKKASLKAEPAAVPAHAPAAHSLWEPRHCWNARTCVSAYREPSGRLLLAIEFFPSISVKAEYCLTRIQRKYKCL